MTQAGAGSVPPGNLRVGCKTGRKEERKEGRRVGRTGWGQHVTVPSLGSLRLQPRRRKKCRVCSSQMDACLSVPRSTGRASVKVKIAGNGTGSGRTSNKLLTSLTSGSFPWQATRSVSMRTLRTPAHASWCPRQPLWPSTHTWPMDRPRSSPRNSPVFVAIT